MSSVKSRSDGHETHMHTENKKENKNDIAMKDLETTAAEPESTQHGNKSNPMPGQHHNYEYEHEHEHEYADKYMLAAVAAVAVAVKRYSILSDLNTDILIELCKYLTLSDLIHFSRTDHFFHGICENPQACTAIHKYCYQKYIIHQRNHNNNNNDNGAHDRSSCSRFANIKKLDLMFNSNLNAHTLFNTKRNSANSPALLMNGNKNKNKNNGSHIINTGTDIGIDIDNSNNNHNHNDNTPHKLVHAVSGHSIEHVLCSIQNQWAAVMDIGNGNGNGSSCHGHGRDSYLQYIPKCDHLRTLTFSKMAFMDVCHILCNQKFKFRVRVRDNNGNGNGNGNERDRSDVNILSFSKIDFQSKVNTQMMSYRFQQRRSTMHAFLRYVFPKYFDANARISYTCLMFRDIRCQFLSSEYPVYHHLLLNHIINSKELILSNFGDHQLLGFGYNQSNYDSIFYKLCAKILKYLSFQLQSLHLYGIPNKKLRNAIFAEDNDNDNGNESESESESGVAMENSNSNSNNNGIDTVPNAIANAEAKNKNKNKNKNARRRRMMDFRNLCELCLKIENDGVWLKILDIFINTITQNIKRISVNIGNSIIHFHPHNQAHTRKKSKTKTKTKTKKEDIAQSEHKHSASAALSLSLSNSRLLFQSLIRLFSLSIWKTKSIFFVLDLPIYYAYCATAHKYRVKHTIELLIESLKQSENHNDINANANTNTNNNTRKKHEIVIGLWLYHTRKDKSNNNHNHNSMPAAPSAAAAADGNALGRQQQQQQQEQQQTRYEISLAEYRSDLLALIKIASAMYSQFYIEFNYRCMKSHFDLNVSSFKDLLRMVDVKTQSGVWMHLKEYKNEKMHSLQLSIATKGKNFYDFDTKWKHANCYGCNYHHWRRAWFH